MSERSQQSKFIRYLLDEIVIRGAEEEIERAATFRPFVGERHRRPPAAVGLYDQLNEQQRELLKETILMSRYGALLELFGNLDQLSSSTKIENCIFKVGNSEENLLPAIQHQMAYIAIVEGRLEEQTP